MTIPGVGYLSALTILAEIGNVERIQGSSGEVLRLQHRQVHAASVAGSSGQVGGHRTSVEYRTG